MDVIDVALKIGVVANAVLPIATLPDAFFPLGDFAFGARWRRRKAA
jgi:hypothetical protein